MRLCFDQHKASSMSNIMKEFSALLKAEVFIPLFARRLIRAPVLSRKGNSEQGW